MIKYIFSIVLFSSIPSICSAMEAKPAEPKKNVIGGLQEYHYQGPAHITCMLDPNRSFRNYAELIPVEHMQTLSERMDAMTKQVANSSDIFAHVLATYYKHARSSSRPWHIGADGIKKGLELDMRHLLVEQANLERMNLEYQYEAIHGKLQLNEDLPSCLRAVAHNQWSKIVAAQKETTKKLMATKLALSFLELNDLDQTSQMIEKASQTLQIKNVLHELKEAHAQRTEQEKESV